MCDPGSITMGVIAAISAVVSGAQQQQQAQAQADYQEAQAAEYARVADLNNKAAVKEFVETSAAERMGQMQEQETAARAVQETQKEALEKKGTMMASTNAAGMALDWLLADYERAEAGRRDDIRHQYEMSSAKYAMNAGALRDRAQNRIDGQQRFIAQSSSYSPGMNMLGTALGIGAAGMNAYGTYRKYKDLELKDAPSSKSSFSLYNANARMATNR